MCVSYVQYDISAVRAIQKLYDTPFVPRKARRADGEAARGDMPRLVASRSLVSIEFGAKCLEREKDRELRERERESCDRAL